MRVMWEAWGLSWVSIQLGEPINSISRGCCKMAQMVIGSFGKNEAVRHPEKVHRFVFIKQGCHHLPEGHLLSSQTGEERT